MTSIHSLPNELLDSVFEHLSKADLCRVACVSKSMYDLAIRLIYREVRLADRLNDENGDNHDDSPLTALLMVLCRNPKIAELVQSVHHSCHFPSPDLFHALPYESFKGPKPLHDNRLLGILRIAISHMKNVHTLIIIHGHYRITTELLRGFFNMSRTITTPVGKLWIESSCLEEVWKEGFEPLLVGGLSSVRIRRLRMVAEGPPDENDLQEVFRGYYPPTVQEPLALTQDRWNNTLDLTRRWDDENYKRFPDIDDLVEQSTRFSWARFLDFDEPWELPATYLHSLLKESSSTLTSLNFDWLEGLRDTLDTVLVDLPIFPNLKAFQVRNTVTPETRMSPETSLFQPGTFYFNFMRNHPKIECLAWPIENFFPSDGDAHNDPSVIQLISDLGTRLKCLRVDRELIVYGEPRTDELAGSDHRAARRRRKKLIAYFAPELRALEILKIEGGVPKDETRELIRALRRCSLKKLAVLGIHFPLKDWWHEDFTFDRDHWENFVGSIQRLRPRMDAEQYVSNPRPTYGPGPALMDVVRCTHSNTITELKFFGSYHIPDLHYQYPDAALKLFFQPLLYFKNLRLLTVIFGVDTNFEDYDMSDQIIQYWTDAQDPTSMTLAPPVGLEFDVGSWGRHLRERFAPERIVKRMVDILGRFLYHCREDRTDGEPFDESSILKVRGFLRMPVHDSHEFFETAMGIRPDKTVAWFDVPKPDGVRDKARAYF